MSEVWQRLLRSPDRFLTIDPRVFHDPAITSREYALRYADDMFFDQADLVAGLQLDAVGDLEDLLYTEEGFDGDVVASAEGVELILGRVGTLLEYPFRESELRALAQRVDVMTVVCRDRTSEEQRGWRLLRGAGSCGGMTRISSDDFKDVSRQLRLGRRVRVRMDVSLQLARRVCCAIR